MKNRRPDSILLTVLVFLVFFGLIMVSSASIGLSQEEFGESYHYFFSQVLKGLLPGLLFGFIAYLIPYRFWQKWAFPLLILSILLIFAVFIPGLGTSHGGAQRWLDLGLISIQPSEILKLTFIIYLSAWLSAKGKTVKDFSEGLIPFLFLIGFIAILILLQKDLGTLGIISFTSIAIFFFAGARISHIGLTLLGGSVLLWILAKLMPHVNNRIQVFLHPEIDPKGIGYQINQALLALGSGGFFGVGLGQSLQKFKYLPEPATDSIVAILGEELGFIGIFCVIVLFIVFTVRGLGVARNAPDNFSQLLSAGITSWIIIQAIINIMAICGLMPLTGITLPFFSLGGSSLTMTLIAMGILLNISKHSSNNS
jgi:cell division protein FtsW